MSKFFKTLWMVAVWLVVGVAACSSGSSSPGRLAGRAGTAAGGAGGAVGGGDGGAGGTSAGECSRFNLGFSQVTSCSACPSDTSQLCSCAGGLQPLGFRAEAWCAFGRCLSSVDCAALCAYVGGPEIGSQFADAIQVLDRCLEAALTVSCDRDAVCVDGRCVGEEDGAGVCRTGDYASTCLDPGDCKSGACVTTDVSAHVKVCGDARPESVCNEDSQCGGGRCVKAAPDAGVGVCTNGSTQQPCFERTDCRVFACVERSALAFGLCFDGNVGDPCTDPSQCRSSLCVMDECSSGDVGARCTVPGDCHSGFCDLGVAGGTPAGGECVSGDDGASCFGDSSCKSGLCGLNVESGARALPGVCTSGESGEPCAADDDCRSQSCVASQSPVVGIDCDGNLAGVTCGDGGVCANDRACHYGRCQ